MSLPLEDLRTKVDAETLATLHGCAKAFDKELSEIVRSILTEYAQKVRRIHIYADAELRAKGLAGNEREVK